MPTDITEDGIREVACPGLVDVKVCPTTDLVDVKVCAVDADLVRPQADDPARERR